MPDHSLPSRIDHRARSGAGIQTETPPSCAHELLAHASRLRASWVARIVHEQAELRGVGVARYGAMLNRRVTDLERPLALCAVSVAE